MTYRIALSAWDMKEIAKRLGQWERLLVKDGNYTDRSNLVSRIEVHRPDEPTEIIGYFVLEDGWVGFQPLDAFIGHAA